MWLDLDGSGDLSLDPTLCDEGNFSFTIPFAFAPGADFLVGPAAAGPDPVAQDVAARQLLSEALVVAGQFRAANGESYEGMTAGSLAALWNGITFSNGFSADVGEVGVVVSVEETDEGGEIIRGVLVTQSASGTFFCAADGPEQLNFGEGPTLEEAEAVCDPASFAAKQAAEAEAEAEADAEEDV